MEGKTLVIHKRIKLREQREKAAKEISEKFGLSEVSSRVVAARGYSADKELEIFLQPTLKKGIPNPKHLKGFQEAVELIADHIASGKRIAVSCDYDVDGLSGGAQLIGFIRKTGGEVGVYIPDRFSDGYGLNKKIVRQAAKDGSSLLVTIDFGTTNYEELALARKLGMKTVVIDHHHIGDAPNPEVDAFINPHQSGCGFGGKILCASGLTWYVVAGLCRRVKSPASKTEMPKDYLALACLGTICDMVPLRGVNRVIAKRGLEQLALSTKPGLLALKNVMGLKDKVSCYNVSFGIGPRINAAGRLVHGNVVIELLTTGDSIKAENIAKRLNRLNLQRQEIENRIKSAAAKLIEERGELPMGICIYDPSFHTGVIGLVAQRLVESYFRPVAVMGMDEEGIYKGSARGIPGFNVVEALSNLSRYLIKFGGHEGAGGFALKEALAEKFKEAFSEECHRQLRDIEIQPYVMADTPVEIADIKVGLVRELSSFAPFGVGNASPHLLLQRLTVKRVGLLKDSHMKVDFSDGKRTISGVLWRATSHPFLSVNSTVDVAFKPDINRYNGRDYLQLHINAAQPS